MNYVSLAIKHQPFKSKEEMNEAIKFHIGEHGSQLSDTEVEMIHLLSRYACKYPGVAFLKNDTIANLIGKSRRTVIRVLNKLVDLSIITRIENMRLQSGGNGANLYIINPTVTPNMSQREEAINAEVSTDAAPEKQDEPLSFKNINKKESKESLQVEGSHLKNSYREFKQFVYCFIPEKNFFYRLYRSYKAQIKSLENIYAEETLHEVGIQALRAMFSAMKVKDVHNPVGYFSRVVKQKLDDLYLECLRELEEGPNGEYDYGV
ncbi:helix-turn-helix domain-containing protein [Pontibacillus yanchengensis]|uniref:Helix-turn-helix domain-containing protein n=2 Tax=Pontibacillus yanchengensis TaxID=462910 RepID=A0ACC7VFT6_9BACI|nr:helix-turn-helix domain-containing protein [Pontibacillus yanchengensis]MYL34312.1 helix-turn-helix domain-containing protein [Pontibacillus yanchengensis]MYL53781.1 helix-turn-helix domain-containing protein [Pontibacillus yanchengensis]